MAKCNVAFVEKALDGPYLIGSSLDGTDYEVSSTQLDIVAPQGKRIVRLAPRVNVRVKIGSSPTIGSGEGVFLFANSPECFGVSDGQIVAIIEVTT